MLDSTRARSRSQKEFRNLSRGLLHILAAALLVLTASNGAAAAEIHPGPVELVSVDPAGTQAGDAASGGSFGPGMDLSADGRWAVFESTASNLVATDTNGVSDVFVRDLLTGQTTLVSVNAAGTDSGNGASLMPVISDDGRYVAFASFASDLEGQDADAGADVFLRDLDAGTTILLSLAHGGPGSGNGDSLFPSISADGSAVAFESEANNLSSVDFNVDDDVFLWTSSVGLPALVSVSLAGVAGNGDSTRPQISADGTRVAFTSTADDLSLVDSNGLADVFVYDLMTISVDLVSENAAGTDGGNEATTGFALARNGLGVAFESRASDLVAVDGNGNSDVFFRNLQAGVTELVSQNFQGTDSCVLPMPGDFDIGSWLPKVSDDGRMVSYVSQCGDLVNPAEINDSNGAFDAFLRDRLLGVTHLASPNLAGTGTADSGAVNTWLSGTGTVVALTSYSTDLAPLGGNGAPHVFLFYPGPGTVSLVSDGASCLLSPLTGGQCGSNVAELSGDGRSLLFTSRTLGMTPNNTNGVVRDVFSSPSGLLFEDGFESGDAGAWDSVVP